MGLSQDSNDPQESSTHFINDINNVLLKTGFNSSGLCFYRIYLFRAMFLQDLPLQGYVSIGLTSSGLRFYRTYLFRALKAALFAGSLSKGDLVRAASVLAVGTLLVLVATFTIGPTGWGLPVRAAPEPEMGLLD